MNIWLIIGGALSLVGLVCGVAAYFLLRKPDAYIYVPEGTPLAQFRYQDIPMKECAWCGRKVQLARHHIESWASSPEKKDDPDNIVVLCGGLGGGCHGCLGHGRNYKRYNANLRETLKTKKWVDSNEQYRLTHGGKDRTEVRR